MTPSTHGTGDRRLADVGATAVQRARAVAGGGPRAHRQGRGLWPGHSRRLDRADDLAARGNVPDGAPRSHRHRPRGLHRRLESNPRRVRPRRVPFARLSARSPYDYWSTPRVPWRPSTTVPRSASTRTRAACSRAFEPVGFIIDLTDRIYHVTVTTLRCDPLNSRASVPGSHLAGNPGRSMTSWPPGTATRRGRTRSAVSSIRYSGHLDRVGGCREDRLHGAREAVCSVRSPVLGAARIAL